MTDPTGPWPGDDVQAETEGPAECPAFPRALRRLAALLMIGLAIGAVFTATELRNAAWTWQSVTLIALAWLCISWMGYWILHSRTRLVGDELVQTWLWSKRAQARDVASLKLVHLAWIDALVAPRLLVRQRNGAVSWFQAADATLLHRFAARVGQLQTGG